MTQVKDVMTRKVVTISRNASVNETIDLLLKQNVSGVPVVDAFGAVVGIISEFRLLQAISDPLLKYSAVSDLMTRDVVTVCEDTPLHIAANLMILHRVRRLPVLRDGRLIGVISRPDLIRHSLNTPLAEQLIHVGKACAVVSPAGARKPSDATRAAVRS